MTVPIDCVQPADGLKKWMFGVQQVGLARRSFGDCDDGRDVVEYDLAIFNDGGASLQITENPQGFMTTVQRVECPPNTWELLPADDETFIFGMHADQKVQLVDRYWPGERRAQFEGLVAVRSLSL